MKRLTENFIFLIIFPGVIKKKSLRLMEFKLFIRYLLLILEQDHMEPSPAT